MPSPADVRIAEGISPAGLQEGEEGMLTITMPRNSAAFAERIGIVPRCTVESYDVPQFESMVITIRFFQKSHM